MRGLLDTEVERWVGRWIYVFGVQGKRDPDWKWRFASAQHVVLMKPWHRRRSARRVNVNIQAAFSSWRLCVCVVSQLCPALCDPMDCSLLGSSIHGDSPDKNTGVGWHALLQGDLLNPGIEPRSPTLQADSLPSEPPGKPSWRLSSIQLLSKGDWEGVASTIGRKPGERVLRRWSTSLW